jgi:hypothetical protein
MTTAAAELIISSIARRLDRLPERSTDLRLNIIKMAVYLRTSTSPALYDECLAACRAAGLDTTSPIATFSADIARVIKGVIDAHK